MKKSYLAIIVSVLVLIPLGFWIYNSGYTSGGKGILGFAVILLIVALGLFAVIRRLISFKRGEPAEDELSKKITRKASSLSYYISLYLWLFIYYISENKEIESHVLFSWGILSMAVIFAICWLVTWRVGIKGE